MTALGGDDELRDGDGPPSRSCEVAGERATRLDRGLDQSLAVLVERLQREDRARPSGGLDRCGQPLAHRVVGGDQQHGAHVGVAAEAGQHPLVQRPGPRRRDRDHAW